MKTKKCNTCKKELPIDNFGFTKKRKNSDNFHRSLLEKRKGDCKPCLAIKAKKWRTKNPNYRGSGKNTKYPKSERRLISAIRDRVSNAKQNNRRTGNPFTINADYMYKLLRRQNNKCKLSGLDLIIEKNTPYTLSIDKIIPKLGYVKGNVQWVCWMANRAKGDLTDEQLLLLCKSILRTCNDYS